MMKVSVIVPVYKVEKYLYRCVDAILAQTHHEIEVILVDDGSPDQCGKICDEYAEKDLRVRVIHKVNGGLSDARNAGLEIATGEWISFIDSDDWIEPNMYEELLKNAEVYGAQISVGGVNDEVIINGEVQVLKTTFNGAEKVECMEPIDAMRKHLMGSWAAWDKIYRREIFEGIQYPVGEINEDEPIMLTLLKRCTTVVYTNVVYYHYVHRAESITTSAFSEKKMAWPRHCEENLQWILKHCPQLEDAALRRYLSSLLWAMREMALTNNRFIQEEKLVRSKILQYFGEFKRLPLTKGEKTRMYLIRYLPFKIYRLLETKR